MRCVAYDLKMVVVLPHGPELVTRNRVLVGSELIEGCRSNSGFGRSAKTRTRAAAVLLEYSYE
jgi:hypothetical protein